MQLSCSENLGNPDQLIVIVVPMEEGFFSEDLEENMGVTFYECMNNYEVTNSAKPTEGITLC